MSQVCPPLIRPFLMVHQVPEQQLQIIANHLGQTTDALYTLIVQAALNTTNTIADLTNTVISLTKVVVNLNNRYILHICLAMPDWLILLVLVLIKQMLCCQSICIMHHIRKMAGVWYN